MTRPVTCPINSVIQGHHSFSFESWHTELPAQTDAHWTVQLLMGHATKTLNQGGSVSGSMSWVLFLDTASFGRSKTMIRLANYEGITRELSDLEACFYWLHRRHSVTSWGSPGSWLTSPLCTWKRWGPAKRALSTLQFNKVCFPALGGLPHIRSETRWGHARSSDLHDHRPGVTQGQGYISGYVTFSDLVLHLKHGLWGYLFSSSLYLLKKWVGTRIVFLGFNMKS